MNSLLSRSLARFVMKPSVRAISPLVRPVTPSLLRPFSISSSLLNQQTTTATSTTNKAPETQNEQPRPDLTPLKLDGDLYAVVKVHNNPFLVTLGDKMILPFNLKTAEVGDVLNFHNVTTIGSRNYTFAGDVIDPELYSVKAVVLEKTKLPMRVREVTKRRNRRVKHAISKPFRTVLRVTELELK